MTLEQVAPARVVVGRRVSGSQHCTSADCLACLAPLGHVTALWPTVGRAEVDWDDGLTTTVPLASLTVVRNIL